MRRNVVAARPRRLRCACTYMVLCSLSQKSKGTPHTASAVPLPICFFSSVAYAIARANAIVTLSTVFDAGVVEREFPCRNAAIEVSERADAVADPRQDVEIA